MSKTKPTSKKEVIRKMALRSGITQVAASIAFQEFIDIITADVKKGKAYIEGVGTLVRKTRSARVFKNPRTGEPVKKPAKDVVRFRAAADLKRAVSK